MATILLIGTDGALLEGLAQLLAGAGHTARIVHTMEEGREIAAVRPPLAVLVETRLALAEPDVLPAPTARGGAVLLYRTDESAPTILPPALQRLVLADLSLPLERHRLLTLIQRMADRALATGRRDGPPEHHPS
jgi:DNA-binding NtrC family response regulator